MHIQAIKRPGTVPMVAFFKTEPPLTEEIFRQFLTELSGYPTLRLDWQYENGLLKGDFSGLGIPDNTFIQNVNHVLGMAARIVERQQNQRAADLDEYLTGLTGNTRLPLED